MKKLNYLPLILSVVLALTIALTGCKKPDPGPLKKSLIITLDKEDITNKTEIAVNIPANDTTFKLSIKCGYDVKWVLSTPEKPFVSLSATSGTGPGAATISVLENTTNASRTNTIIIMEDVTQIRRYLTLNQAAATN